jgi:hypothetical protein
METDTVKIWCLATGETDLLDPKDTERFAQLCEEVLREAAREAGGADHVWVGIVGGRKHMASILQAKAASLRQPFRVFHVVLTDDWERTIMQERRSQAEGSVYPEDWSGVVPEEMLPPLQHIRLVRFWPPGEVGMVELVGPKPEPAPS